MIKRDKQTKNYCQSEFREGDYIADRWGRMLCEECDKVTPAPVMSSWAAGKVSKQTLEIAPGLKCGDIYYKEDY